MQSFVLRLCVLFSVGLASMSCATDASETQQSAKLRALIIDGQNNHGAWPKTSMMMKDYLLQSGLFDVDIYRAQTLYVGPHNDGEYGGHEQVLALLDRYSLNDHKKYEIHDEPQHDPSFIPDFGAYDVVISNFGWLTAEWPKATSKALEDYVDGGGGLVIVHAANNCFGDWDAYNQMIGLGGWGGRDVSTGPYVYYDEDGELHRDSSDGPCGNHGPQHEFAIVTREPSHPIMRGLPAVWLHTKDELYELLRGPAKGFTVLATAYAPEENYPNGPGYRGSGRHEPALMAVEYGQGRVFHTILGHVDYSMECVGFITTLQRGAEWAATGNVTQEVPKDFPGEDAVSSRSWDN